MKLLAKWGWLGLVAFGLVLVISGLFMVFQGKSARDEVTNSLADERIITSQNAEIPMAKVTGPDEAKAQAEVIKQDVLKMTGGKTFAELDRSDPNRNTYVTSIALRTALMQSYMAFKVADLVIGVGALVAVLGLAQAVLGLYLGFVVVKRPQPSVESTVLPDTSSRGSPPSAAWTGTGRTPQPR
jgi:hypothetical protein